MIRNNRTTIDTAKQKFVTLTALLLVLAAMAIIIIYLLASQAQPSSTPHNADLLSTQAFQHFAPGAVLVGAVTVFLLQMAFNLISISLGIIQPQMAYNKDRGPVTPINLRAVGWVVLSTLIAGFIGGQITASIANLPNLLDSLLHMGFIWTISLLISAISVFIYSEMPQSIAFLTVPEPYSHR